MLNPLAQMVLMANAAGVDATELLPKRVQPKEVTQADFDRIAAAEAKRQRKAAKRLSAEGEPG